jgi:hypothetical protein
MSRCTLLAALLLLCARCAARATLVFAHYYPPNRDAGSDQRLLHIIATAVRGGHSIYFVCPKAGRAADLQALEELIGRNRTLVLDKALRAPPQDLRRLDLEELKKELRAEFKAGSQAETVGRCASLNMADRQLTSRWETPPGRPNGACARPGRSALPAPPLAGFRPPP